MNDLGIRDSLSRFYNHVNQPPFGSHHLLPIWGEIVDFLFIYLFIFVVHGYLQGSVPVN
jgi:hypothetical protein